MKEEILKELIKGLCDIFVDSLDSIILYGSYARNEEREDTISSKCIELLINQFSHTYFFVKISHNDFFFELETVTILFH